MPANGMTMCACLRVTCLQTHVWPAIAWAEEGALQYPHSSGPHGHATLCNPVARTSCCETACISEYRGNHTMK